MELSWPVVLRSIVFLSLVFLVRSIPKPFKTGQDGIGEQDHSLPQHRIYKVGPELPMPAQIMGDLGQHVDPSWSYGQPSSNCGGNC